MDMDMDEGYDPNCRHCREQNAACAWHRPAIVVRSVDQTSLQESHVCGQCGASIAPGETYCKAHKKS